MLVIFGIGILVGVAIVVGLLRLTMREDPAGCILPLGSVFLLLLIGVIFGFHWLLSG